MSRLPPSIAYAPIVIPYPGTPGAPFFDGQNITDFLDRYSQLCADYRLSESEKIYRLPWYCEVFTGNYIRILIKGADWAAVRSKLRREYKENDLDQLMYSREFLEALKKKSRSEDDDLLHYCQLFASISRDLILRRRLDVYSQCQWFLQGLPERIVTEIFYRYDIDLEDDDSLDFEDLLEKALVVVKRSKCLADFLRDKKTDLVSKFTEPQEKIPTAPNIVEPIVESFTYEIPELAPTIRAIQGSIQVPVARIHKSPVKEVKIDGLSLGNNDCILASDLTEDPYEYLSILFSDLEPGNEEVVPLYVDSVSVVGPVEDIAITEMDAYEPGTKTRKAVWEFHTSLKTEAKGMKKIPRGVKEETFPGFDDLVVGKLMRGAIKCEDYGWV